MTTLGRVADDGEGAYSALVEYDEPGPFCVLNGPDGVSALEAVGWARGHAARVIIRDGGTYFSAGEEGIVDLPPWPSAPAAPPLPTGERVPWRAEASTGWYRDDRRDVAQRLADALDAVAELDETGFSVGFTVMAGSEVEANERASRAVRAAWDALGVEAVPGEDFDVSAISVRPA